MNRIYLTTVLLLLPAFAACDSGSILDLAPIDEASVDNFYKNPDDYVNAVNGVYASLRSAGTYNRGIWLFAEMRGDNTRYGRPLPEQEVDRFNVEPTSGFTASFWRDHYAGIARANAVLDRLEKAEFGNPALRDRLAGEAKFLRALMYFNLVRAYGEIPLVLKEIKNIQEGYTYGRAPVAKVYEQIIADLKDAAAKLPASYGSSDLGRATKGAAHGLLGAVYLTNKDYSNAKAALETVIQSGQYQLWPTYADVFKPANAHQKESLFEVEYKAGNIGQGSSYMFQYSPYPYSEPVGGVGSGEGLNVPTDEFIALYEPGDLRKAVSMKESFTTTKGEVVSIPYITKYHVTPFANGDTDANWIVLRYADILLMYAEVLNEQGQTAQALTVIDPIRTRAGLQPLRGLTQQQARAAIDRERRIELAFEGQRWWDIIRSGRAVEIMNTSGAGFTMEPYEVLYPIPQAQIDVINDPAKLWQNPGY